MYDAEIYTCRKIDQKYVESYETWCWRRVEMITWSDRVRSEEVSHSVKGNRNILRTARQCTYNVTSRGVHVTIVAVEKPNGYYVL